MFALYYNSHIEEAGESYKLLVKYNFLKHLSSVSKLEFSQYFTEDSSGASSDENRAYCLRLNHGLLSMLGKFLSELEVEVKDEDFVRKRVSMPLSMDSSIAVSIEAAEINEIDISFSKLDGTDLMQMGPFDTDKFSCYFTCFIYDTFLFSRYIDNWKVDPVSVSKSSDRLCFNVLMDRKLAINLDME